jgi:hypothetical protein
MGKVQGVRKSSTFNSTMRSSCRRRMPRGKLRLSGR